MKPTIALAFLVTALVTSNPAHPADAKQFYVVATITDNKTQAELDELKYTPKSFPDEQSCQAFLAAPDDVYKAATEQLVALAVQHDATVTMACKAE